MADDQHTAVPTWQGEPITAGWWWLRFSDGPGPRYWDGTFWDRGSSFIDAEDYAEFPIMVKCVPPEDATGSADKTTGHPWPDPSSLAHADSQFRLGYRQAQKDAMALDPCLAKREADEPMFILLARDTAAPGAIEKWCEERELGITTGRRPDTPHERQHIDEVRAKVRMFNAWRKEHRDT